MRQWANGYTASGGLAPFVPMASFFVMENEEAKNPLLEKEIRAKITKLLEQRGYSLVPYEQADYYLRFTYGMGAPQTVSVATPSIGIGIGFRVPLAGSLPGDPIPLDALELRCEFLQIQRA